jgi:hypothetical protein
VLLDHVVLPFVSVTVTKMEHRHILRGFTAILLVGGLGVRTNYMAWCLSKEEVYRSNVRTDDDLEQQIQDTLATVFSDFLRKRVESVSAILGDVCSNLKESGRVGL